MAARKASTYRARIAFALLTSVAAAGLLVIGESGAGRRAGDPVFSALALLCFVYCLFAGARQAADCLSEEKREGTLGLLFLTDLHGYDVVLGKFTAIFARVVQGLFAFFPVLAIALVLGGITGGEFWRATAVLTNTLFFSVCIGLWASALSRQTHVALALTFLVLSVLTVGPFPAKALLSWIGHQPAAFLSAISPAEAGRSASDLAYRTSPTQFWVALCLNHLFGWVFLILASLALPHSWQEAAASRPGLVRALVRRPSEGIAKQARRIELRRRLLAINPIYWLAARDESQRWLLWLVVIAYAIGTVPMAVLSGYTGGQTLGLSALFIFVLRTILKVWVAWRACATLAEARRTGAVELLLATPLKIEEVIGGHWQALQRFFFWPVMVAVAFMILPALAAALTHESVSFGWLLLNPLPGLALYGEVTFVLDLAAAAWVGMWMGLSQTKAVQAFGKTVLWVVIVPAVVFCFPNVLFDVFWITWARGKLEHEFRRAAGERFGPSAIVPWAMAVPKPGTAPPVISPKPM